MVGVFDLFAGEKCETRVLVTEKAVKEIDKKVHDDLLALFHKRAISGMRNCQHVRWEGNGVWAFGTPQWHTRIAGYFLNDQTRDVFVVGGVWDGKPGNKKRPPSANAVIDRIIEMRQKGVYEQEDDSEQD